MQIKANQLESHLQKALLPVYLISGEDPLLKQEARDAILKAAAAQTFLAHEKLYVEARFNWDQLSSLSTSQDLFSDKKVIEIINTEAKFDTQAAKALSEYLAALSEQNLLIIVSGKLNASQVRSSWYQQIDKLGACLTLWPLNSHELQTWLKQRFSQAQIKVSPDAAKLLLDLCENNLLALQQAITKIKLLYPELALIDQEQVMTAISNHSRYTIFDFTNSVLQGDAARLLHVLDVLRQQGTEPSLLLWALAKEVRNLFEMIELSQRGENIQKLIDREIFSKRPFVQAAIRRVKQPLLKDLLAQLTTIDQSIKGANQADIWLSLNRFSLRLAGSPT